jgi:hypothetical protein
VIKLQNSIRACYKYADNSISASYKFYKIGNRDFSEQFIVLPTVLETSRS